MPLASVLRPQSAPSVSIPRGVCMFSLGPILRHNLLPTASQLRVVSPVGLRYISTAQNPIPASFLRGGTSKGIFLNRASLPNDRVKWDRIFLGIMGSPDPEYGRQLNGMGGGVSSLSKICIVGPPSSPVRKALGVQAEYTFVQVGIKDGKIDLSGNCGNLTSVVGVFAVDEGICVPMRLEDSSGRRTMKAKVRLYNMNTHKIIDTTFPIDDTDTPVLDIPETSIAGVPGKASTILLEVVDPAGARTGKLLPTGSPLDLLEIELPEQHRTITIDTSCVDATNPTVFVSSSQLSSSLPIESYLSASPSTSSTDHATVSDTLEHIRRSAAVRMGLDPSAQAQPKIALVSAPSTSQDTNLGVDLVVHALSMGVLHRAVPTTVGLCCGVAARVPGTLPWRIVQETRAGRSLKREEDDEMVRMRHPSGIVDVGAKLSEHGEEHVDGAKVESATVVRTGRRLMRGVVWW